MKIQDITRALDERDQDTIRDAFRRLVDFPHEGEIEARSHGILTVALNKVRKALQFDAGTMPRSTCSALDLPLGATYAQGAQAAEVHVSRLARRFADALERQAGFHDVAAGRAL